MSSENQKTEQVAADQGAVEQAVDQAKQTVEQATATAQDVVAKVVEAAKPVVENAQAAAQDAAQKVAETVQNVQENVQQNGVSAAVPTITGEAKEQQDTEMGSDSPPKDKESPSKVPAEEATAAGTKRERPLSPLPPQTGSGPFPPPPLNAPAPAAAAGGDVPAAPADASASSGQDAKKPKLDEEATKTEEAVKSTDSDVFQVSEEQLAEGAGEDKAADAGKPPGSRGKDSVTSTEEGDKISTRTRSKASA